MRSPGQCTWGVDVGSSKLAIACVLDDELLDIRIAQVKHPAGAQRLALLRDLLVQCVRELAPIRPPLTVWVEQPFGKFPKASLDHAVGVTLATLYTTLAQLHPFPVAVITTPVPEWKKRIGLPGNAPKPAILARARDMYGYVGKDQDCADAVCIAHAGQLMTSTLDVAQAA